MDLKEICISTRNWVDAAQDREYWRTLVNSALNLRVPKAMELVSYSLFIDGHALLLDIETVDIRRHI